VIPKVFVSVFFILYAEKWQHGLAGNLFPVYTLRNRGMYALVGLPPSVLKSETIYFADMRARNEKQHTCQGGHGHCKTIWKTFEVEFSRIRFVLKAPAFTK
jgi:hypothetical protein